MAKTALTQLQDQIEAVRREAFAAGYAAAMQSIRDFTAKPAPGAEPAAARPQRRRRSAAVPARPGRPARQRQPRAAAASPRRAGRTQAGRPQRGTNRLRSAARCSATRAWRWRSPRSAMRSSSSRSATRPNRSPTARRGGTTDRLPERIHCAVMPPSMTRPAPVMKAASSEARKTIPLAMSVTVPMRPIGSRSIT